MIKVLFLLIMIFNLNAAEFAYGIIYKSTQCIVKLNIDGDNGYVSCGIAEKYKFKVDDELKSKIIEKVKLLIPNNKKELGKGIEIGFIIDDTLYGYKDGFDSKDNLKIYCEIQALLQLKISDKYKLENSTQKTDAPVPVVPAR